MHSIEKKQFGKQSIDFPRCKPYISGMYRNQEHIDKLGSTVLILAAVSFAFSVFSSFGMYARQFIGIRYGALSSLSGIVAVVFIVFFMIWHYHNWDLLDEDLRKTSPGRAVGFLFIPFYNLYWVFVSFIWLWEGLNEMGKRYMQRDWLAMQQGIPIAFAILIIASAIPFVVIGAGVLTILLILQTNSRTKELLAAVDAARKGNGQQPNGD